MLTRTVHCGQCGIPARLTVHAETPTDPRVWVRCRLLAGSQGWVIDFDNVAWCPEHKPRHGKAKRRQ